MRTALLGASMLTVLFFSTSATAAESVGVVAVADPPGPTPELAELTHQLRLVVAEHTTGVLDPAELRERMAGQTSSATLSELDRAYAGALATYQNGDFEGSIRTLRAVIQDLERLPARPEAFSQWTRAMLRLARAEQTVGNGAEAREVLDRLVRANPAVKADVNQYPPSFARQVEDAKAHAGRLVKRKLTVTAMGKRAKVFVEGREVGMTPITLDLPPGRYRVSGALGNVNVPPVVADLNEEGQKLNLDFALAESLRPNLGPGLAVPSATRERTLVTAGNWLGVDKLLAAGFVKENGVEYLTASLFDVRRGMLLREGRIRLVNRIAPTGSLTALSSFLITGQSSTFVAQAPVTPPEANAAPEARTDAKKKPEPKREKTASLDAKPPQESPSQIDVNTPPSARAGASKIKGWVAVGTGILTVGLGGLAIYEGMAARSSYAKSDGLLQPDGAIQMDASVSQYKQYVADGDSAKNAAYVSAGAAVGCAVVSGVLGYIAYKQTGEIGPFRF